MKNYETIFFGQRADKTDITLIEGDRIIQDDPEVAQILSDFFRNAVASLNVGVPNEYKCEESTGSDDPIENIISKYNHPSIKMINENIRKGCFSFNTVNLADIEKEVSALNVKKASMSSSIPPKFLKEHSSVCCKPLTKIISNGILNSCFDNSPKVADVTHTDSKI